MTCFEKGFWMQAKYGNSSFGFEDLEVYQAARALRKGFYKLVKLLPVEEKFALAPQMRRAAVSLTSNIAEGYGRFTWQDTTHFCRQARGSLMELIDHVNVCADQQYAEKDVLDQLKSEAERALKLLNGYIAYLQRRKQTQKQQPRQSD